jgi:hypothetical protein
MDDDVFGTSIWNTPSYPSLPTKHQQPVSTIVQPPPQLSDDFADSQNQFDDFDNSEAPPEALERGEADDDDFGDFGDFGDTEIVEGGTISDGFGFEQPPALAPVIPLRLDPMPDKSELRRRVDELLGPVVGPIDRDLVTDEPIREREGPDQILVTRERRVLAAPTSRLRVKRW